TLTPPDFAVLMDDAVHVCDFDGESFSLLGPIACESIAFFEQCLDVRGAVGLLGLGLLDEVAKPLIVIVVALGAIDHRRRNRESQGFCRSAHVHYLSLEPQAQFKSSIAEGPNACRWSCFAGYRAASSGARTASSAVLLPLSQPWNRSI